MKGRDALTISPIDPGDPARASALRLILGRSTYTPKQIDRTIEELRETVRAQSLNTDLIVGVWLNGRLVDACLSVESPGRTALLLSSDARAGRAVPSWRRAMFEKVQQCAWDRELVLLQVLIDVEVADDAVALRDAGFIYLAELVYMERDLNEPLPERPIADGIEYIPYSHDREDEFIEALEATYVESHDCPRLTGLRKPRDILLGHKHTGEHDPDLWFLALRQDAPAGILLLSGVRGRSCLEIVYMGVCVRHRGQGVGDALMARALHAARERGNNSLTLAVDSINIHARRLYDRWGLREVGRRRAWAAINSSAR